MDCSGCVRAMSEVAPSRLVRAGQAVTRTVVRESATAIPGVATYLVTKDPTTSLIVGGIFKGIVDVKGYSRTAKRSLLNIPLMVVKGLESLIDGLGHLVTHPKIGNWL